MDAPEEDTRIHERITRLVGEEHALREHARPSDQDRRRLQEIEVQLDQAWDLLRQREALRDAGRSPGAANARPPGEVEGYLQ